MQAAKNKISVLKKIENIFNRKQLKYVKKYMSVDIKNKFYRLHTNIQQGIWKIFYDLFHISLTLSYDFV